METKSVTKNGEILDQNLKNQNSSFNINKDMWRFKLHYFVFIGGIAAAYPYIPDYAKNRIGISTTALAMILMIEQFLFVITKPMIGYLADYFDKLKALICILTVLQQISFFLILFIPKLKLDDEPSSFNIICLPPNNQKPLTGTINFFTIDETNELFSENYTIEIITDVLAEKSEIYNLRNCFEYKHTTLSTVSANIADSCNKLCYKMQLIENRKSLCKNCLKTKPDCLCVQKCSFTENFCLCSIENNIANHKCTNNNTYITTECLCSLEEECFEISLELLPYSLNVSSREPNNVGKSEFYTYQFWIFGFLHTFGMMCNNAMFTLSDTACCESVVKAGSQFGRQRLWGAIGWGLMAPIAGLLNDYTGSYLSAWLLMEVALVIVIWNILKLDLCKPQFSKNILKDVGTVLKSAEFLTFEAGLLMNGIGAAMVWYYLVLFLISIGASKMLCGLSLTVQSFVGTIPCMFFSDRIINKLGPLNVVSLALFMYAIRFLWYSFLYNPWYVLFVEYLHGFTYGLLYANIASYGKISAKPGTEATTHSILFSTHEGLGAGLGCVFGGIGLDYLGGRTTFLICSIFAACGLILHQIAAFLVRKRNKTMELNSVISSATIQQYI